jgi:hypothetical protein
MSWTMPRPVLQIVAAVIVLAAVAAFAAGVLRAPDRGGRLPGEKVAGASSDSTGQAIDAEDATPLDNDRIEGPPPAPKEEAQAEPQESEADAGNSDADGAAAPVTPAGNLQAPPVLRMPPPAPQGNAAPPQQTLGGPPAADEPPH